jgi:hypothetical protein
MMTMVEYIVNDALGRVLAPDADRFQQVSGLVGAAVAVAQLDWPEDKTQAQVALMLVGMAGHLDKDVAEAWKRINQ